MSRYLCRPSTNQRRPDHTRPNPCELRYDRTQEIVNAVAEPLPKLDLYDLARKNADNLHARYEQAQKKAAGTTDALERFCSQVQRAGRVSINTRSARLLSMLRKGYYPNPYDEARERAQREGGDSEEYLKQQQHDYYLKRVTFERSFVDGESFRYASLNIGGPGLSYYGLYCLVLRDPTQDDRAALLPANSLKRFMNDEPRLDEVALRQEVAPWSHRHYLAACKHAHEVAQIPDHAWPTMMCHATETVESFMEIILGSPIVPQAVIEIRIDETRFNDLVDKLVMDTLSDAERTEVSARVEVFEELARQQLDSLYKAV